MRTRVVPALCIAALLVTAASAYGQDTEAVKSLDKMAAEYYLPTVRAVFGTFTFEYSELPTQFSRWAEDRLLLAAAGSTRLKVLNRNAAAALDPVLRESYGAFLRETGAEALVSGRFFLEDDRVRIALLLTELSSGTMIGAADWIIPVSSVPDYASVKPASVAVNRAHELAKLSSTAPGGLTVSASTDRGAGAAYRAGENLTVIVGVNKDAWVRVYHVDGAGQIQLIWPNRFSAGEGMVRSGAPILLPPDTSAPYSFLMEPPYGIEFIKVVASSVPFLDEQEDFSDLGSRAMEVMTRGLSVQGTGASSTKPEVAEALASYYIGP
ncbi:MAG: hypothetical protein CVV51_07150 [Spirochaetae bacterium HGW-Spirochaetae-7]|jgi:hypothetical protein|nr:MAG: hypothetical protein CVV51_07150 [Spirochaetae bacterium HGW-Spirochaetae-7]